MEHYDYCYSNCIGSEAFIKQCVEIPHGESKTGKRQDDYSWSPQKNHSTLLCSSDSHLHDCMSGAGLASYNSDSDTCLHVPFVLR